jgi:hypothetical protein
LRRYIKDSEDANGALNDRTCPDLDDKWRELDDNTETADTIDRGYITPEMAALLARVRSVSASGSGCGAQPAAAAAAAAETGALVAAGHGTAGCFRGALGVLQGCFRGALA